MTDKWETKVGDLMASLEKLPKDARVYLLGGTAGSASLDVYDSEDSDHLGYLLFTSGEWAESDEEVDYL